MSTWIRCGAAAAAALLSATPTRAEPVDVAVVTARAAEVTADVAVTGSVQARTQSDLSFRIAGEVAARRVDVDQRDAVFDVAEATAAHPPVDTAIRVALATDPAVTAVGRVREVAPQLDRATNTVRVKVGLDRTSPAMTLGAAVVGSAAMSRRAATRLPWSALDRWDGEPTVWVVDAANRAQVRTVVVLRYGKGEFTVADGVADGDRVVSSGIQFLRPGVSGAVVPGGAP